MKDSFFNSLLLVLLSLVIGIGIGYFIFNDKDSKLSNNANTSEKTNNVNETNIDDFYKHLGDVNYQYYSKEDVIKIDKYYEESEDNYYKYAVLDIDGDKFDDIIIYEPFNSVFYNIALYKGSEKGYYYLGRPVNGAHYSNSQIIKFKDKNYLTYNFAHMSYQYLFNIKIFDDGYTINNVLNNEISNKDKYYIDSVDENTIESINWIKI